MSIKKKSDVIKNIVETSYEVAGKSYTKYQMYFGTDGHGKKIRASRNSRKAALDFINDFYRRHNEIGDAVTVLTASQIYDAQEAFRILSANGIDFGLAETVRRYLEMVESSLDVNDISIGKAYDEYYASIPAIQKLHRKSINFRVRPWVSAFGPEKPLSKVTAKDIVQYLSQIKSITTYNNKLSYIKTFLTWCSKPERRYIDFNPVAGIKPKKKVYSEPEFMSAEDFEKLVRHIEKREDAAMLMNYIALNYMCGVRREEISRIMKEPDNCILMEERSIRVSKPKGWTQGRKPRMFEMPENAYQWLKKGWHGGKLCYEISSIYRIFTAIKKETGIRFYRNSGRHTFITMHVAAYETPEKTDYITGTSGNMRSSHYQGLVSKAEALRYFDILPS